jgi:Polyketide cyclase / dehydrase and lipid transport
MVARQSFYIDAPVETVFEYFKDPNLTRDAARYDLGEVKLTKDGVGTYSSWSWKVAGLRLEGFEVLTEVVPNKHITERSSMAQMRWDYDFAPEGSGTRLTITVDPGSLWRFPLLDRLFDLAFPRVSKTVMPRFIQLIEEEASKAKAAPPRQRKPAEGKPRKAATSR